MNGNEKGVPIIGKTPKMKIIKSTDADAFEKEFNIMTLSGWTPSNISHQMFYDHETQQVITAFLCMFTRVS